MKFASVNDDGVKETKRCLFNWVGTGTPIELVFKWGSFANDFGI